MATPVNLKSFDQASSSTGWQNPLSRVTKLLNEKIASHLIRARAQTIEGGEDFLSGLSSARDGLIGLGGKEIQINTDPNTHINGVHFEGLQKRAIIYLHGNGCYYETSAAKPLSWVGSLGELATDGTTHFPHLVLFNPRGTGKSTGIPHPNDIARDLFAVFEYLVRGHSIDPNDVVIAGHSMGAFFAAEGAALVQREYPDHAINFLSDRSFFDIGSRTEPMLKQAKYSRAISALCRLATPWMLSASQWNSNPIRALESLKGRVCIVYHEGDTVIPYDTSLHNALTRTQRTRSYTCLSLQREEADSSSSRAHNREFNDVEHRKLIAEFRRMFRVPLPEQEDALNMESLSRSTP